MSYSIKKADLNLNKTDIIGLMNRNLGIRSEEWFQWKYLTCPYGVAHCWLVKDDNSGNFIGTAALFPRRILVKGQPVYAGIAGDFSVNKEHRILGPAIKLQKTLLANLKDNNFYLCYGTPNKLAEGILSRAGYVEIGNIERMVKLLKSEYKFIARINNASIRKNFARFVDFFLKVLSKDTYCFKKYKYKIEILESFDARFNILWERANGRFEIIGERTASFLNWRHQQFPKKNYKIFTIIEKNNEIAGYVSYYEQSNIYYILDLLTCNDEILDSVLTMFIRHARKSGISSISINYFGKRLLKKKLMQFGFIFRGKGNKLMINFHNICPSELFLNRDNWYFFSVDEDNI